MNPNYEIAVRHTRVRGEYAVVEATDISDIDGTVKGFRIAHIIPFKIPHLLPLGVNHRREFSALSSCMWNTRLSGPKPDNNLVYTDTVKTNCRTNVIIRDPSTGKFLSYKKLVAAGFNQFDLSILPATPWS